jgi:hypothetical protein
MRDVLTSRGRWLQIGWVLPLALLVLPNCALDSSGTIVFGEDPPAFDGGSEPRTSAIMCEIPKPQGRGGIECADDTDVATGMPLTYAAIALAQNEQYSLGLDYSPGALSECNGNPRKIEYFGPVPDGLHVCLNCAAQIPAVYVDAHAACVAKCVELVAADGYVSAEGAQSYCQDKAKIATNVNHVCYTNACSSGGTPIMPFDDPRRAQELVKWDVLIGQASFSENDLSKGDEVVGGDPLDFDTGAAAAQTITSGDAWVEFEVTENDKSHVLGVSSAAGPYTNADITNIGFALSLNFDGFVYVLENYPNYLSAPLGPYAVGDRFRVKITDNHDGTASIKYTRLDGPCVVGTQCAETEIATQTQPNPSYPLRISASFREPNATLSNVTLVRIKEQP